MIFTLFFLFVVSLVVKWLSLWNGCAARRVVYLFSCASLLAFASLTTPAHAQTTTTTTTSEEPKGDPKPPAETKEPQEDTAPSVTLLPDRNISRWYDSAAQQLEEFFERDNRNVTPRTFQKIARHANTLTQWTQQSAREAWERPVQTTLHILPILTAIFLGALVFALVSWQLRKVMRRARDKLADSELKPWASISLRTILHALYHIIPPLTLQFTFAVALALYTEPNAPILKVLRGLGWLVFEYCAIRALITSIVQRPLSCLDDNNPGPLARLLLIAVFLVVTCQSLLLIINTYRLGDDIANLVLIALYVGLCIATIGLIPRKNDLLALIETSGRGTINTRFKSILDAYYGVFLGGVVILLLFWAIGFTRAASSLLIRGYSLIGLIAVVGLIQKRVEHAFDQRERLARTDAQRAYIDLVHIGVKFVLITGTLWAALHFTDLETFAMRLIDYPIVLIGSARISVWTVLKAIFSVIFAVYISRLIRPLLDTHVYPRFHIDISITYAINTVLHYLILAMGLIAGLHALQVDFSAFIVVAGALGVGIGLGLQNITHNLVSGFILLFGRSVRKGDSVTVDGHFGVVESVGARAVTLMTPDRTEVIIPSSHLVSHPITNYSYTTPTVRVRIPVGVHYGSDVRQVEQALLNAAYRHQHVLRDPAAAVWLDTFGDNSVNFTLLVYINIRSIDIPRLRGELNFHIWDVLKEQNIEIPYPQRDLHIRTGPGLEHVTHALRGEGPPEPTEHSDPPRLDIIPSYLNRSKTRPQLPNENLRNIVMDHLRNHPIHLDPKRRIRDAVDRFLQARTHTLEQVADRVENDLADLEDTLDVASFKALLEKATQPSSEEPNDEQQGSDDENQDPNDEDQDPPRDESDTEETDPHTKPEETTDTAAEKRP